MKLCYMHENASVLYFLLGTFNGLNMENLLFYKQNIRFTMKGFIDAFQLCRLKLKTVYRANLKGRYSPKMTIPSSSRSMIVFVLNTMEDILKNEGNEQCFYLTMCPKTA